MTNEITEKKKLETRVIKRIINIDVQLESL